MKYRYRSGQVGLLLAVSVLLFTLFVTPVRAASRLTPWQALIQRQAGSSINATIYLTTATLQPLFQSKVNQQVPGAVNSALTSMVGQLPQADRSWASQMAATLIQPSVTLSQLTPQQNGLVATLRFSLYPGDPHPTMTQALVKFSVLNASTIQVSTQPLPGSPSLVSGPVATLQVPVGQLNNINGTPGCGDAALALGLNFPLNLGQTQSAQTAQSGVGLADIQQTTLHRAARVGVTSYIEIPASSLASLGGGIGTLTINSSLTARNIRIAVQNGKLVVTSDVYWNNFLNVGTATTYVQPTASNGNLAAHVTKTTLTLLQLLTFPNNTYNQQIQQVLNAKLNPALAGKFTVSSATIGGNSSVPCAANDSLLLSGTTALG